MSEKKQIDPFLQGQRGSSLPGKVLMLVGRSLGVALQVSLLSSPVLQPVFSAIGLPHLQLSFPGIAISETASIMRLPIQGFSSLVPALFKALSRHTGNGLSPLYCKTEYGSGSFCNQCFHGNSLRHALPVHDNIIASADEKMTPVQAIGLIVFATGLCLKWFSELQHLRFEDDLIMQAS